MEPTPEPPPRTLGQGLLRPLALPMMMMSTMECQPTLRSNMERQSTLRQYYGASVPAEPPPRTLGQGLLRPLALPMMMMSTMERQSTLRSNMERQSTLLQPPPQSAFCQPPP